MLFLLAPLMGTEVLAAVEGGLERLAYKRSEEKKDAAAFANGCRRVKIRGDIQVPPGGVEFALGGPGQRVVTRAPPPGMVIDAVDPPGTPPPPPPMSDADIAAELQKILGGLCYFFSYHFAKYLHSSGYKHCVVNRDP